jgi:hypothetical protein
MQIFDELQKELEIIEWDGFLFDYNSLPTFSIIIRVRVCHYFNRRSHEKLMSPIET